MIKLPKKCPPALYQVIYEQCGGFVDCGSNPQAIWEAAVAEVQRLNATAQPVSDWWVKCSERMPAAGETVLVYMKEPIHSATDCAIATYDKYGFSRSRVTHWMPLPAAPGGQENEQ